MKPARTHAMALLCAMLLSVRCGNAVAGNSAGPLLSRLEGQSWSITEPVRTFTPVNLYEEINGEAELYLPYDFRELTVAYLARKGTADVQMRLEIFGHGSPRDAFGIYSQQRFPGQETVSVGPSEAIVSDASLDFFRGDLFIRIRAASRAAGRGDLLDLGRALSESLAGSGSPPPEAGALIVDGFVPGSLVFQKKAILGYDALAPGYEAKYSRKGEAGSIFMVIQPENGGAKRSIDSIAVRLPGFTKAGTRLYRADISAGSLWLRESGARIIGVAGNASRESAEKILSEIEVKINRH